jgi:hypothetical protein
LGSAQGREASGTLSCDECLETRVHQGGLFVNSTEAPGLFDKRVVEIQSCPQVHQYARMMHIGQSAQWSFGGRGETPAIRSTSSMQSGQLRIS